MTDAASSLLTGHHLRWLKEPVIKLHLNSCSGLSPYQQLVQQVRHALRLGLLHEGDRLPTVKDVAKQMAVNPNTVLKAYRELEHNGLVAARPGVGTFVTRTLADGTLAAHGAAALADQGPPGRARRREHRGAVHEHIS